MFIWPDLVAAIYEKRVREWRRYPQHTNRASSLGGDCERHLVYARTHWDQAAPPDPGLLMIFKEGEKHERAIVGELQQLGFGVLEQQATLEWRDYELSGHLDAVLEARGSQVAPMPLDIKSMSPHIWSSIFQAGPGVYPWAEVAQGFDRKPWLRKYAAQVYLYCLMRNSDRGMLLCINKSTGELAQVNLDLDYDVGESLLKRAERVNAHVKAGTLPDRIQFDPDICGHCEFYHICYPEQQGKDPIAFLVDEEVEQLLADREAREAAAREYKRMDERIKAWAKAQDHDQFTVGPWLVTRKQYASGVRVSFARQENAS